MQNLILFFKGLIIGIANIIPGISGGTMIVILGIYENILKILKNPFKDFKKNIIYIIPLFLGVVFGIILFANIIGYLLENYEINTKMFFLGIIIGCIPLIIKNFQIKKIDKNILYFLFGLIIIVVFSYFNKSYEKIDNIIETTKTVKIQFPSLFDGIKLFFSSFIAAGTMIIPGISGSFVLVLLGEYYHILGYIKDLMVIQICIVGLGIILGLFCFAKFINFLLQKYKQQTYYTILGIILGSLYMIFPNISIFSTLSILYNILFFGIGILFAFFSTKMKSL